MRASILISVVIVVISVLSVVNFSEIERSKFAQAIQQEENRMKAAELIARNEAYARGDIQ